MNFKSQMLSTLFSQWERGKDKMETSLNTFAEWSCRHCVDFRLQSFAIMIAKRYAVMIILLYLLGFLMAFHVMFLVINEKG